jgi:DNA-binding SARP family transcriptional activator
MAAFIIIILFGTFGTVSMEMKRQGSVRKRPAEAKSPAAGEARRPPAGRAEAGPEAEVRIRLLGGFEVWQGDKPVGGFESQKVRALLAYLVSHRDRAFSREHLAGLLWPDRDPEAARHALRQAVYNLKTSLPDGRPGEPVISSDPLGLRFNVRSSAWVDVAVFEDALRRGREQDSVDPHYLSAAVHLYRGELLAGFFLKDSEAFEEWLVAEQERLREAALDGLRTLIEVYRRRGEHRLGIHYARRLIAIEPLSEETCRDLMRMCARAGRRSLALAEYERLKELLARELGVDPLRETRDLYQSILQNTAEEEIPLRDDQPIGPLVLLAGRAEPLALLRAAWQRVLGGQARLVLVTGEAGVGKTRLIRTFLDAATSQKQAAVLKGRCFERAPMVPYCAVAEMLASVMADPTEAAERVLASADPQQLADIGRLCPGVRELRQDLPVPTPLAGEADRRRLFESVGCFVAGLCIAGGGRSPDPVILFLDDLHLADQDTRELLEDLVVRLADLPVLVLLASRSAEAGEISLLEAAGAQATRIDLGRLPSPAVREIAGSLVGEEQSAVLAHLLDERGGGLPLAIAELINHLWDEGLLIPQAEARWRLAEGLDERRVPRGEPLQELVAARVRRLPSSARRLTALAAVAGHAFESALLEKAGDEHAAVVEIGLEVLLRRWLIRQRLQHWSSGRRQRDIVLWSQGARRGTFEFAHPVLHDLIYDEIHPLRRQVLHREVADALEGLHGARVDGICEVLAHHYTAAGVWNKAFLYLEMSALRARDLQARDAMHHHGRLALQVLDRLEAASPDGPWRAARGRLEELFDDSRAPRA